MPRKKTVNEEKRLDTLIRKRENERKRLSKMKSDPISAAILKDKEHLKYLKKKEKGQIKSITDLSIREQRKQRRIWRENKMRHRVRKKVTLEDIQVSTPAENNKLEQSWLSKRIELKPLTNTSIIENLQLSTSINLEMPQLSTSIKSKNTPQLSTSIKLEKPHPSTNSTILVQAETFTKGRFYIRCKEDFQPIPSSSLKLEKPQIFKSASISDQTQPLTNTMIEQPWPSESTKILEKPLPLTKNRFYIRSKDELQPAPSTSTNVFRQPQPSTCTKIVGKSQFSTSKMILEQPQLSTNAYTIGKLQPLTRTKILEQSQPSSNTDNFEQPHPAKNIKIFTQSPNITKGRFYIRTKEEK